MLRPCLWLLNFDFEKPLVADGTVPWDMELVGTGDDIIGEYLFPGPAGTLRLNPRAEEILR